MNNNRYTVQVQFKNNHRSIYVREWDICEDVKDIIEARSYKSIIDDTVKKARVVDRLTNKVVEDWVK